MVRSRLGLKALGLCALAIGMMAFGTAGVAQALETGGVWTYINSKGELKTFESTGLEPKLGISLENHTIALAFTTGGGTSVKILCTGAEFDEGGELGPKGSSKGEILLGRIKFTGCVTLLNGVLSKPCEPNTAGGEKGVILTLKGLGLILLHEVGKEKVPTILLEPDPAGKPLVDMELGPECSIGEGVPVAGHLVLIDCKGAFKEHMVVHLVEEFSLLRKIIALGQPAKIEGSAEVFLTGVGHAGLKWAGLPN